jgi:hypothetical protein
MKQTAIFKTTFLNRTQFLIFKELYATEPRPATPNVQQCIIDGTTCQQDLIPRA